MLIVQQVINMYRHDLFVGPCALRPVLLHGNTFGNLDCFKNQDDRTNFALYQLPLFFFLQEVRESRRIQEQRIVEVDSGVRRDYEFKLAQALQVR